MTEPNVLGNVSPCKFLFDSGNTEIINLWRKSVSAGVESFYHESATTVNGVAYVVPANRVYYLLNFHMSFTSGQLDCALQGNTSVDTSVNGTTKARFRYPDIPTDGTVCQPLANPCCIKFVAGEYITPFDTHGAGDFYCTAWGIECNA